MQDQTNPKLKQPFRSELPNVTVKTIHSVAYQATADLHRGMVGEPTKTDLKEFLKCGWDEVEKQQKLLASFCASADSKFGGQHDARTKKLQERLWTHFASGHCTFRIPHNVYLKLLQLSPSLRDQAFESYGIVVLDEAQDCTDCMLDILKSKQFARVIACDPHQNIYQFNHVDGKYLAGMHVDHHMSLPQSFRFGNAIANFLTRVARASPGQPDAVLEVHGMPSLETRLEVTKDPSASIQSFLQKNQKVTVLARKNSTLFFEAMRVVVSLDDGKTISFIGGFDSFKESQLDPVLDLFYLGQQRKDEMKSRNRNYLARFSSLVRFRDKCESDKDIEWLTKFIIYDKVRARGPESFQQEIETFENKLAPPHQADVVFSTVHQAKGLGFENVVTLKDFLEEHTMEEYNIFYVACSRTSTGTLCIADSTIENLEEHERGRRGKKRPRSSYDLFDDFDDPFDEISQFEEGPEEDEGADDFFGEFSDDDGGFEDAEDDEDCEEDDENESEIPIATEWKVGSSWCVRAYRGASGWWTCQNNHVGCFD